MEIWDAYNRNSEKIHGLELVRGEIIPQGIYHLCVEVAVKNQSGKFLLMKRSHRKHGGGKWELSAGGSVLKGESPKAAVRREVKEETGLDISSLNLLGIEIIEEYQAIYYKYLAETFCNEAEVTLQLGETVDFKWLKFEEITVEDLWTMRVYNELESREEIYE
ncbi:MAG: NUDIX domain-containing protein [Gemella sp.]|nr:NUDIX domain-containing protein [Gemella sp.]